MSDFYRVRSANTRVCLQIIVGGVGYSVARINQLEEGRTGTGVERHEAG